MPNSLPFGGAIRRFAGCCSFLLLLAPAAPGAERAATGSISGRVIALDSGQNVSGAVVSVRGTALSAKSDLNGSYALNDIPPGSHSLLVVHEIYQNSVINGIKVVAGDVAKADLPMEPIASLESGDDVVELSEFVISADVLAGSELALIGSRRRAAAVSDAIGEDTFSRLSLGSASDVVGKSVGSAIVDGKYAVIRGLGDRYTNTLLNNVSVPSADPDRRAVQLDQFPSDLLESVVVSKSFTPDQPGAFSGGSVNLRTKSFPASFFFSGSIKGEFHQGVTGREHLHLTGGGSDWKARDDGTRAFPADLPAVLPSNLILALVNISARRGDFAPAEQLDAIAKAFNNDRFYPGRDEASPNFGSSFAFGDRLQFGGDSILGYVFSFTYDAKTSAYTRGVTGRYSQGSTDITSPQFVDVNRVFTTDVSEYNFASFYAANPQTPLGLPEFGVSQSSEQVDWSTYAQVAFRPALNHEASVRFLHNQSAEDRVRKGVGEAVRSDSGGEFRENYDLLYTERAIRSLQLQGKSLFPGLAGSSIEWRAARSTSTQDQPDYKNWEFKWSFVLQGYDPSGIVNNRYFRDLEETTDEYGVDFTVPLIEGGPRPLKLKFGGLHAATERTNRERAFVIENASMNATSIPVYPAPVGLIDRLSNGVVFGSYPREIAANLNYDGILDVAAGYLMADWQLTENWRAVAGARIERTEMATTPRLASNSGARAASIDQSDVLPGVSLVRSLGSDQNLRFAYGRTIARPTFRELADVSNYEAFTDEFIAGNPDLQMSVIDNFDARWERFLTGGRVLAVSAFHKRLKNPIELTRDGNDIRPQNSPEGTIIGLEFEGRTNFGFLNERLSNLTIGANLTWIDSAVEIPVQELALIRQFDPEASDERQLFSQSPYIVNVDATWELPSIGSTFTTVYSISGERLDLVTSGVLPDVFEKSAPSLDFIVSQRLGRRWKLKLTARNLLDPDRRKILESNGTQYVYESYRAGRRFSLGLSYFFE